MHIPYRKTLYYSTLSNRKMGKTVMLRQYPQRLIRNIITSFNHKDLYKAIVL